MSYLVRKQVHLSSAVVEDLAHIVRSKGGRRKGYSFSRELEAAARDHIQRSVVNREEATSTPIWEQLLTEKFSQTEAWLRPGVWGSATYATTAALLLLELMCGKTIDPKDAKDHFELIRSRAWKMVRRDPSAHRTGAEQD